MTESIFYLFSLRLQWLFLRLELLVSAWNTACRLGPQILKPCLGFCYFTVINFTLISSLLRIQNWTKFAIALPRAPCSTLVLSGSEELLQSEYLYIHADRDSLCSSWMSDWCIRNGSCEVQKPTGLAVLPGLSVSHRSSCATVIRPGCSANGTAHWLPEPFDWSTVYSCGL